MEFVEVALEAQPLEEQVRFYGDVLELPVERTGPSEVVVQAGRSRITFHEPPSGDAPTYHFAFRVPGDRFHEAKEWLSGRVDLLQEDGVDEFDWDFWDAHAVYAEDPARNVIELIAFAGLDEGGGAAFSGASILALADLGLPVPDPRVAVASLAETFGIGLWDRPEVTPDRLSPVGGRGATLLVVRIGRVWHLGEAAAAQPLDVPGTAGASCVSAAAC